VLSLRVLGPGESEAEESSEMEVLGEGVYPSAPARGSGECCKLPQQGLKLRLGSPAEIEFSAF